jgi:hypothetical protein
MINQFQAGIAGLKMANDSIELFLTPQHCRESIIGFSLPQKILESTTFEIQMNSPEGGKKMMEWERSGN